MSIKCPLCSQELPVDSSAEVRLEDAAKVLNVSESCVERMLERDELPHRTVKLADSYKVVLIPMTELVRLRLVAKAVWANLSCEMGGE